MDKFIETIRVVDGKAMALPYHQARVDRTLFSFTEMHAPNSPFEDRFATQRQNSFCKGHICLAEIVDKMLNSHALKSETQANESQTANKTYKARIIYDCAGNILEQSISPYHIRNIKSLRLIDCNEIDYSFKYADRSKLNLLASQANGADEVIIVRNGLLTDTSYSNIALFDGIDWHTPRTPLLRGTMRQHLLDSGLVLEDDISPTDLSKFKIISLINAMMPLEACCLDIDKIITM